MVVGHARAARAVAIVVVGGAFLAGACSTDRDVTEPDPLEITSELLAGGLLTDADVPSPYVLADDAELVTPELVPEHECDDQLKALEPSETAQVTFVGSGFSTLTNVISHYPGQGAEVNDIYEDLLEDCAQVVDTEDGLRFTTKPLDFGVLSDDTMPLVISIESDDGSIQERNVIVMREGDLFSTIRLNGPRPSDKVLLDTVTRVAIGNLGELAQETS